MEARELKVNNLIDYNGFTAKVLSVNAYSNPSVKIQFTSSDEFIYIQEESLSYQPIVKPIPLTEEWLIKFGFELDLKHGDYLVNQIYQADFYYYVIDSFEYNSGGYSHCEVKIEHVHQLQNLYFALTGEELTIKE